MLFTNAGILPHQNTVVKSEGAAKLTDLSVGRRVVASAGGENIRDLILRRRSVDGIVIVKWRMVD